MLIDIALVCGLNFQVGCEDMLCVSEVLAHIHFVIVVHIYIIFQKCFYVNGNTHLIDRNSGALRFLKRS